MCAMKRGFKTTVGPEEILVPARRSIATERHGIPESMSQAPESIADPVSRRRSVLTGPAFAPLACGPYKKSGGAAMGFNLSDRPESF
jgi:hypothetical protein